MIGKRKYLIGFTGRCQGRTEKIMYGYHFYSKETYMLK
jgi:hypothetical protein